MKKCLIKVLVMLMLCGMLAGCSGEKQHIKLINEATQAIFSCPNADIIDVLDSADIPALDKVIADTYAIYFTDLALEDLSANQLLVKHHINAFDGGYTTTVSEVAIDSTSSDPVEYRFTATLNYDSGESIDIDGRAQFHCGDKISHLVLKLQD